MTDFPANRIDHMLNNTRDGESTPLTMEEKELDDVSRESKNRAGESDGWSAIRRVKSYFRLHERSYHDSNLCEVSAAGMSFKGSHRKQNEDCWQVAPDCSGFIVADGMGGCPAGDVASQLTVNVLADELGKMRTVRSQREALRALNIAFEEANSRVVRFGRAHDCAGLGAAVVAAIHVNNRIYVAGVGDCRAYLLRGRKMTQLTSDDTLAAAFLKTGLVNAYQVNRHAFKNVLARCIGSDPFQPADEVGVIHLKPGDRVLLCSDGLYRCMADSEIASAIALSGSAGEAAKRIKGFAQAASARDDTTCIVIYADDEKTAGSEAMATATSDPIHRHYGASL